MCFSYPYCLLFSWVRIAFFTVFEHLGVTCLRSVAIDTNMVGFLRRGGVAFSVESCKTIIVRRNFSRRAWIGSRIAGHSPGRLPFASARTDTRQIRFARVASGNGRGGYGGGWCPPDSRYKEYTHSILIAGVHMLVLIYIYMCAYINMHSKYRCSVGRAFLIFHASLHIGIVSSVKRTVELIKT